MNQRPLEREPGFTLRLLLQLRSFLVGDDDSLFLVRLRGKALFELLRSSGNLFLLEFVVFLVDLMPGPCVLWNKVVLRSEFRELVFDDAYPVRFRLVVDVVAVQLQSMKLLSCLDMSKDDIDVLGRQATEALDESDIA